MLRMSPRNWVWLWCSVWLAMAPSTARSEGPVTEWQVPVPEGAMLLTDEGGLLRYKDARTPARTVEFYRQVMAGLSQASCTAGKPGAAELLTCTRLLDLAEAGGRERVEVRVVAETVGSLIHIERILEVPGRPPRPAEPFIIMTPVLPAPGPMGELQRAIPDPIRVPPEQTGSGQPR